MPKYLKGLADMAMDKASRMKRARELDFDVDTAYTHTGQTDITKINKGGLGNIFDGVFAIEGGGYSLGGDIESDFFLRNNRLAGAGDADLDYDKTIEFLKKEYPGEDDDFIESIYEITAGDEDIFDKDVNPLSEYGFDDTGEASWEAQRIRGQIAADQGFDAITMNDELGDASILIPHGTGARRTNAAFDPEKKDSSDLLAGLGSLGVGLGATGAALTPEEAEAGVITKAGRRMADLAMDKASRMKRAEDIGFGDQKWIHVTDEDFTEFDPDSLGRNTLSNASDPSYGATSLVGYWHNSGDILDTASYSKFKENLLRANNPLEYNSLDDLAAELEGVIPADFDDYDEIIDSVGEWVKKQQEDGYDSVKIYDEEFGGESIAVFNPNQIRSINAAFDPEKSDSSDLLAGLGSLGVGLGATGAALTPEEAEAGVITKAGRRMIDAWHGTPHDVDRFRTANIGTGEGAQVYGHGLYFADKRGIGESYRDTLSPDRLQATLTPEVQDQYKNAYNSNLEALKNELEQVKIDAENVPDNDVDMMDLMLGKTRLTDEQEANINKLAWLQQREIDLDAEIRQLSDIKNQGMIPSELEKRNVAFKIGTIRDNKTAADDFYEKFLETADLPQGNLYNVNIDADPDTMLDWDKTFDEQTVQVRQGLAKIAAGDDDLLKDLFDAENLTAEDLGVFTKSKGSQIYNTLASQEGGHEAFSSLLEQAGIPGIKYADYSSRGKGADDGTKNYVVFNDKLIEIVKKYGIAGAAVMAGMEPEEVYARVHGQDQQSLDAIPQDTLYQGGDVGSIQGDPAFPSSDSPPNETMLKLADYLYGADNRMKGLGDFLPFEGMANLLSKYAQDQPADWWDYFDAMP